MQLPVIFSDLLAYLYDLCLQVCNVPLAQPLLISSIKICDILGRKLLKEEAHFVGRELYQRITHDSSPHGCLVMKAGNPNVLASAVSGDWYEFSPGR